MFLNLYSKLSFQIKLAIGFILITLVVAFVSKAVQRRSPTYSNVFKNKIRDQFKKALKLNIQSKQDMNSLLSLQHAVQSNCVMESMRNFLSDYELSSVLGVKYDEIRAQIQEDSEKALRAVSSQVPALQVDDGQYAIKSGWL